MHEKAFNARALARTVDTLVVVFLVLFVALLAFLLGRAIAERSFRDRERFARDDAVARSRATLSGQFSEQLAPYLPGFPYSPCEAKFLGKPTDFIVFEGLEGREITRVVFVEVKTGKSSLSGTERSLKRAIDAGRVAFETYRVPHDAADAAPEDARDG